MSLLTTAFSPLDNVQQNLPEILQEFEQDEGQFFEWIDSLSVERYKGDFKFPIFTGNNWSKELVPHWNHCPNRDKESGADALSGPIARDNVKAINWLYIL